MFHRHGSISCSFLAVLALAILNLGAVFRSSVLFDNGTGMSGAEAEDPSTRMILSELQSILPSNPKSLLNSARNASAPLLSTDNHKTSNEPHTLTTRAIESDNVTSTKHRILHTAIVGFPKSGTSSLLAYLRTHKDTIQMPKRERCEICDGQEDSLMQLLDEELKPGNYIRGLKCPRILESKDAMDKLNNMFPGVSIIVGLRHPVLWFESFYNFRLRKGFDLLHTRKLIGDCPSLGPPKRTGNACTNRAKFHEYLARLGKTPLTQIERAFFASGQPKPADMIAKPFNNIFLYEVSQMDDQDTTRVNNLRKDLGSFLGLSSVMNPLPTGVPPNSIKMEIMLNRTGLVKQIDICDPEHNAVRQVLQETATNASRWIRQHFLQAPGVVTSSPAFFEELLTGWEKDPCEDRRT